MVLELIKWDSGGREFASSLLSDSHHAPWVWGQHPTAQKEKQCSAGAEQPWN